MCPVQDSSSVPVWFLAGLLNPCPALSVLLGHGCLCTAALPGALRVAPRAAGLFVSLCPVPIVCFPVSHRYPHRVVNFLSLEEAKHRYGGVVSVLPIVLDSMRDWVTHSKLKVLYIVSPGCARCKKETPISQTAPEVLTSNNNENTVKLQEKDFKKFLAANQRPQKKKAPWRPPGKHPY